MKLAATGWKGILEPRKIVRAPRAAALRGVQPARQVPPCGSPATCSLPESRAAPGRPVRGAAFSGSRGAAASQHQACSRESGSPAHSDGGDSSSPSIGLRSASLPARKIAPALPCSPGREQRGVCGLVGGARGRQANQRLCLHAPPCSLSPGQHPVAGPDGFIFPRRKRTNAVDNCSGTADK